MIDVRHRGESWGFGRDVDSSFGNTPPERNTAEAQAANVLYTMALLTKDRAMNTSAHGWSHAFQRISEQQRSLYSFPNSLADLYFRQTGKTRRTFHPAPRPTKPISIPFGAPIEADEPTTAALMMLREQAPSPPEHRNVTAEISGNVTLLTSLRQKSG
jgi:hypothetical protein